MSRVFVPIPISGIEEEKEQPSLTYKLDLDTGRIVGKVDGLEAVNQFILKALLTPRFHCLVYDNQYGSEIKDTVTDENATEELIRAEIPRLVEDALLCDGRILKVYDFEFEFNEDSCNALRQWAKRETDPNVIGSIYYGCTLPEDLEKEVEGILSAAQAQIVAIINKLSA